MVSKMMHTPPNAMKTSQFEKSGTTSKSTPASNENGGSPSGVPFARNERVSEVPVAVKYMVSFVQAEKPSLAKGIGAGADGLRSQGDSDGVGRGAGITLLLRARKIKCEHVNLPDGEAIDRLADGIHFKGAIHGDEVPAQRTACGEAVGASIIRPPQESGAVARGIIILARGFLGPAVIRAGVCPPVCGAGGENKVITCGGPARDGQGAARAGAKLPVEAWSARGGPAVGDVAEIAIGDQIRGSALREGKGEGKSKQDWKERRFQSFTHVRFRNTHVRL